MEKELWADELLRHEDTAVKAPVSSPELLFRPLPEVQKTYLSRRGEEALRGVNR